MIHRRATATGTGIDTSVLRITTAYTTRGQVDTVTQYDNATVGSGSVVDEVAYTYDEWRNPTTLVQDWNSTVSTLGSGDDLSLLSSFGLARSQGSGVYLALRRTGATLPDGTSVSYAYDSTSGRHDDELSRVSRVQVGLTTVARYEYNGLASLVGTELLEPDLLYTRYSTGGSFDRIDRFNRVTSDIWSRGIDTGGSADYDLYRDYYDVDITWSRSSNIDLAEDQVYPGWDTAYTNDGLERLTQAKRGTWNGSSITTPLHDEQWTLGQTGNWEVYKLDLNGDTDFTDTNELNDDQTFNVVNELTARDTDDNGADNYDLVYDAAGNLTDDDKDYEFVYDAWGRLRKVNNQSQALVAEYTYNGLGYRTGWHYDVDGDGTVEANTVSNTEDPWFQFVYDTRWMITATYRASHYSTWTIDAADRAKEQFVYHNAGLGGGGGSSYIDSVILRDRDANTAWESQADQTLESRVYYCQNWRADVVALMTSAGALINQVRYDPYGVPFGIAKTDLDGDGDVDNADATLFATYHGASTMPFADWNWDGTKDLSDQSAYTADKNADSGLGRGVPAYATWSHAGAANRKLYAGYEIDPVLTGSEGWQFIYHVRHRVYLSQLGRWTRRDPLAQGLPLSVHQYTGGTPTVRRDARGLAWAKCGNMPGPIGPVGQPGDIEGDVVTGCFSCETDSNPDCEGECKFAMLGAKTRNDSGDVDRMSLCFAQSPSGDKPGCMGDFTTSNDPSNITILYKDGSSCTLDMEDIYTDPTNECRCTDTIPSDDDDTDVLNCITIDVTEDSCVSDILVNVDMNMTCGCDGDTNDGNMKIQF